jgi:hyperosmotically inducible protein
MSRTRAVEIARSTDGVARVIDNLTVTPPVATTPTEPDAARAAYTDPALTAAVKTKLLADTMVGGLRIDVDTQDAVVTLTGNVKTQQEREKALQLARETDGVKGVTDRLTIKP